jgi:hypothetical protein
MDPDPAICALTFKTPTKKQFFISFSAYYLLKVHLHHFSEIKNHQVVYKTQ